MIALVGVSIRQRGKEVLSGVNWTIGRGEQWAIVGPNGAGKTSLVKAIAGIIPTSGGTIRYNFSMGASPGESVHRGRIGFVSAEQHSHVFQKDAFSQEIQHFTGEPSKFLTVYDYVLDISENTPAPDSDRIETLFAQSRLLGMEGFLQKRITTLPTGDISKVLILKQLLVRPRLLILDEPFSGLGKDAKGLLTEFIDRIIASGTQLILITHHVHEIIPQISHLLLLNENGSLKMGDKAKLLREPGALAAHGGFSHFDAESFRSRLAPVFPGKRSDPEPTPDDHLIEMKNVRVEYGSNVVFQNLCWTVCRDENWMLSGPDGSGKSSLLKMITGENTQAYANDITLFGEKKGTGMSLWQIREKIGYVSLDMRAKYPPNVKGYEIVGSGFFNSSGLYNRLSDHQIRQVERVVAALDISSLTEKAFGELSQGQRQMFLIGRAIIRQPVLLILDEPLEGLDFVNRKKVSELIEFIGGQTSTALIYATSDSEETFPCITHHLRLVPDSAALSIDFAPTSAS
mgnify:FL=1